MHLVDITVLFINSGKEFWYGALEVKFKGFINVIYFPNVKFPELFYYSYYELL